MKRTSLLALAGVVFSQIAIAGPGLATRDLNPVLQPIFLPTRAVIGDDDGWRVDHSFYITNTLQSESRNVERLVIDVENYRYELGLGFRRDQWLARVNIPLLANSGGELDGLIDSWHDFFGLPEGDRDDFAKDEINIEYLRDGSVEFAQGSNTSGIGDLSIAVGFETSTAIRYFVGIELPTGSEEDFSGNEAVDLAIWASRDKRIDETLSLYGLRGLSFQADDGTL